jgi:hypothetical protein
MLHESGLLPELQRLLSNAAYSIFRDPAYPNGPWLWGGFRRPRPGLEQQFNTTMSSVRESIEWGFKELACYFKYSELKVLQKIYKSPIGKNYVVCVFIQNLRTTFYGNQTSDFFGIVPMNFDLYLDLIYNNPINVRNMNHN